MLKALQCQPTTNKQYKGFKGQSLDLRGTPLLACFLTQKRGTYSGVTQKLCSPKVAVQSMTINSNDHKGLDVWTQSLRFGEQAAEDYVDRNTAQEGGGGYQAYNWDTTAWGVYVLLAQIQGSSSEWPTKASPSAFCLSHARPLVDRYMSWNVTAWLPMSAYLQMARPLVVMSGLAS